MSKNILVFSDGTGQAGGLTPDENRSNIYKMFRATRCGPDTSISADEQIAFYDAGLGSQPPHGAFFVTRAWRWLHNVASQATGLGITTTIVDCYAWIVRVYEPGDRIYLFGFSRGAYTVRCLAAVLSLCGVPTRMPDGKPVRRDVCGSTAIAKEAVKQVYQFVSSPEDTAYVEQRRALAAARQVSGVIELLPVGSGRCFRAQERSKNVSRCRGGLEWRPSECFSIGNSGG
jgi:type VI secretion system (T6SS) phospholipase Tle1-like effector